MGPRARLLATVAMLLAMAAPGQRSRSGDFEPRAEFHFVRLEYTDLPQFHRRFGFSSRAGRGEGWWMMDWPDAEEHFTMGVRRLTRIAAGEPRHFRLTDDGIFDHPWIYATQVGWWDLSEAETARLREYLVRGGFLVVDDFYGPEQWDVFRQTMQRALPGRPIVDIPDDDPILHVLYDIGAEERIFIPGTRHLRRGGGGAYVGERPTGTAPAWRGIYDDRNRLVVAVNFNMDVADAWEYADWPEYPQRETTAAYHYGINYLVYALTH